MPEEVLFETELRQTRGEVATYLRTVADRLEAGDPVTFEAGGEPLTLDPPAEVDFEVKAEREGPADGSGELSIEFELEWDEDQSGSDGDGSLSIN
jgi:amphi-Trp domain-containing protein